MTDRDNGQKPFDRTTKAVELQISYSRSNLGWDFLFFRKPILDRKFLRKGIRRGIRRIPERKSIPFLSISR